VWFKLVSITLGNPAGVYSHGDIIGVATSWAPPPMFDGMKYAAIRAVLQRPQGSPAREEQAGTQDTLAGAPLIELAGRSEVQAEQILAALLQNGVLIEGEPVKATNRSDIPTVAVDAAKAAEILAQHAPPSYAGE
jgi:hypothetical protein